MQNIESILINPKSSKYFSPLFPYGHCTLHNTTQLLTRKSCNVRGSTTRQKLGLIMSDLTMLDICDKA